MNLRFLPLLAQVLWVGTALAQSASESTTLTSPTVGTTRPTTTTSALTSSTISTIQPTTTTSALTSSTISTIQSTTTTSVLTSSTVSTTRPTTSACPGNSPSDRSVWCDYSINTDYEFDYPNTGNVRRYTLNVQNSTIKPLGFPQTAVTINGSLPGPTIYADWGDWVVVTVINSLSNGMKVPPAVSIHWHGIRQLNTTQFDGVPSITQCPIAPGGNMTYIWRATQYGTAWYHSHVGLQAWEGVFGGIVINGPATSNYDVDLGVLLLNDWDTKSVYDNYVKTQTYGALKMDTGLLNGTNVFRLSSGLKLPNGTILPPGKTGARFDLPVNPGIKYRLRLVNAAVDTMFNFMIDSHPLTVIAMDLVPIQPVVKQNISLTMGQRYDVIFTADQLGPDSRFMVRSMPLHTCSENNNPKEIYGYLTYTIPPGTNIKTVSPSGPKRPFTRRLNDTCYDEPMEILKPYVAKNFGGTANSLYDQAVDVTKLKAESVGLTNRTTAQRYYRWTLNDTTTRVWWKRPTLRQIIAKPDMKWEVLIDGVVETPNKDEWVYLLIDNQRQTDHPIHLHGHDFYILAQGEGEWQGTMVTQNPPRRDTAMLLEGGHLVIGWKTDNPGAWLMHCHIGWHTEEGFALQFIERQSEITPLINQRTLNDTCDRWEATNILQAEDDSGV